MVATSTSTSPKFYTVDELAELLKVKSITVRRLVARRELAAYRIGRAIRIRQDSLDAYLAGRLEIGMTPDGAIGPVLDEADEPEAAEKPSKPSKRAGRKAKR